MTTDLSKLAEKLTKYQRERVSAIPDVCCWGWADKTRWPTKMVLFELGVIVFMPTRPTPLGLALRDYLKTQGEG